LLCYLTVSGFVQELVEEKDELGLIKSRPKKKGTMKQTKQRRNNIQKSQYRFQRAVINTAGYQKYFDPSIQEENRLLGIGEMVGFPQRNRAERILTEILWLGRKVPPSPGSRCKCNSSTCIPCSRGSVRGGDHEYGGGPKAEPNYAASSEQTIGC
jgi:hypothetical protein